MALQSRTFNYSFLPSYVANTIVEVAHFRDLTFQNDELTAFYLDQALAVVNITSLNIGKVPDLTGDETDGEKSLALIKAESSSQKIGLKVLTRKNNTGNWIEIAEFVLLNYGRKDYLDLRTRLGYPTRLLEKNDALGFQLVDYGDGLLWDTDAISLSLGFTIDVSKKNDVAELSARIAALELALEGKLINLLPNTLLGRNSANNGVVEVISQTQFVEQIDLETVILTHKSADDHTQYLTNSRGDAKYASLTGNQTISGIKIFTGTYLGAQGSAPGLFLNETHPTSTPKNALVALDGGTFQVQARSPNFGAFESTPFRLDLATGNTELTGFTTLGDNVGIKVKQLTGITAASQGATVSIPHGLSGDKIQGWLFKVAHIAGSGISDSTDYISGGGHSVDCYHGGTNFLVTNSVSSSAQILSKPFTILVFYIA